MFVMSVTKSKEGCQPLGMSLLFRCCRWCGWSFLGLAADAVHVCVSLWIEPHEGEGGVPMGGGAESSVRGEYSDSNEQCLSAPHSIPLILRQARCKGESADPRYPVFPMGNI